IAQPYLVRLLPCPSDLPLVKAVRRHQTPLRCKSRPEDRLVVDLLGKRVDHPGAQREIARPGRHQAPAGHVQAPALCCPHDDRRRLGWRDVVPRYQVEWLVEAEFLLYFSRRGYQVEAPAHGGTIAL